MISMSKMIQVLDNMSLNDINVELLYDSALVESINRIADPDANSRKATHLYIRREGDASRGQSKMKHGPSVKIIQNSNITTSGVPIKFNSHDPVDFSDISGMKISKNTKRFIISFILDNQVLLSAYWYTNFTLDEIRKVEQYILERFDTSMIQFKNRSTKDIAQKSPEELQNDRIFFQNELRRVTCNDNLVLEFGKDPT